jgi:acyl carrier protein
VRKDRKTMTDEEVLNILTTIFRSELSADDIVLKPETTTREIPKWDSFHYVEIILQIEAMLAIKIRAKEANALRNVGEMVALIQSKKAAA